MIQGTLVDLLDSLLSLSENRQGLVQFSLADGLKLVDFVSLDLGFRSFFRDYTLRLFSHFALFGELLHQDFIVLAGLFQYGTELHDLLLKFADFFLGFLECLETDGVFSDLQRQNILLHFQHRNVELNQLQIRSGGDVDFTFLFIEEGVCRGHHLVVDLHGELGQLLLVIPNAQVFIGGIFLQGHTV